MSALVEWKRSHMADSRVTETRISPPWWGENGQNRDDALYHSFMITKKSSTLVFRMPFWALWKGGDGANICETLCRNRERTKSAHIQYR